MLRLWPDQVRIALSPERVTLLRQRRGWNARVIDKRIVDCAPVTDAPPWRAALTVLAAVLPEFIPDRADTLLVLSNHFVRYVLVPDSAAIKTRAEEQALLRHRFTQVYGDHSDRWALRLSDSGGVLRVASAVDTELLAAIDTLAKTQGVNLGSIQPYLMAAFNQWRAHIPECAWFALVETGKLCIAYIEHGEWRSVKSIKADSDWPSLLSAAIERERLVTGVDGAKTAPVLAFAPGYSGTSVADSIQLLQPALPQSLSADTDCSFAMALTG